MTLPTETNANDHNIHFIMLVYPDPGNFGTYGVSAMDTSDIQLTIQPDRLFL